MEFDVFQSHVAELRKRKPVWFGLESDPVATEAEVSAAELSLGATLPATYRHFVKEFGGGFFAFGNVFSVKSGSEWDIVQRNQAIAIPGFVAISDNGTGDYYGFKITDANCDERIYLWDHETTDVINATQYSDLLEFLSGTALTAS